MKTLGYALLAGGLALVAFALTMSVAVDPDPQDGVINLVANNDLMNQRLVFALVGSAAFICGWLALILNAIAGRTPAAPPLA